MSETAPSLSATNPVRYRDRWNSAAWTVSGSISWWSFLALPYLADFNDGNGWLLAFGIGTAVQFAIRYTHLPASRVPGLIPPATLFIFGSTALGYWIGPSRGTLCFASIGLFAIIGSVMRNTTNKSWFRNMTPADLAFQLLAIASVITHLAARKTIPNIDSATWEQLRVAHLAILGFLILVFAWTRLFRPLFEMCVEAKLSMNYRVVVVGADVPLHGPVIVIANHACLWDPLFLAKSLPRPVTPMMTSLFYDRWYIKPLVKYVFGTIRVPDSRARREAPEIQDAIRALDDGKCLMIFPESYLRRREEMPLRRFGRGIWEILKARPDTPIVCCWIEGAWGSYSSHWNGPPTQNKPKEPGRRTITIGISEPIRVPKEAIERHLATRIFLMNEVSAARRHVGLEPLPTFELPAKDDEPEQPA